MATKVIRTQTTTTEPVEETVVVNDAAVVSEPTVVETPLDPETYTAFKTYQIVYFIFGLIELLLLLRFILKLLGANPLSGFVDFIYTLSNMFTAPFAGIFQNVASSGSVIEWSTLVAMVVYAILSIIIAKIIEMLTDTTTT